MREPTPLAAGAGADAGGGPADSLAVSFEPEPGGFDDLHTRLIAPRCAGQPGLCHNGQFEPNLSTAGLAFVELVQRASLEKPERLRVAPGAAARSMLIDKLRKREVSTRMPLGAAPLKEEEIAELETWIEAGALRSSEAAAPAKVDLPPRPPELAIFDAQGTRLDGAGPVQVTVGSTLVLRHSVQDFEKSDAEIPFSGVRLTTSTGEAVSLVSGDSPDLGPTSYDASAPMGAADLLDRSFSWTVPATITLIGPSGTRDVSPIGLTLSLTAIYTDELDLTSNPPGLGYVRFAQSANAIEVQP